MTWRTGLAIASILLAPWWGGCGATDDVTDDDAADDDAGDDDVADDDAGDDDVADDDAGDDDLADDDAADDDIADDDTADVDCEALPAGPVAYETLTGLYASEDFAFDDSGHMISHDANALFKQEYPPGAATVWAITDGGPGGPASMRMLPTGDLVYTNVDTATLYRVEPDGTTYVVYGGLGYPTGIDIHSSGMVFLADLMGIMRIDPYSGAMEILIDSGVLMSPNGMTFSADYSVLYFGTMFGIYSVQVDADGTPLGVPQPWADSPGGGELLGMGIDLCDNVYALHDGESLLRYPPTGGPPDVMMELPGYGWMTNLQWGSGIGGWDDQAIYITDRNATAPAYYEVAVEVPSKPY